MNDHAPTLEARYLLELLGSLMARLIELDLLTFDDAREIESRAQATSTPRPH